jgi:hypothetical protein
MRFRVQREFKWDGRVCKQGEHIDIPKEHPRLEPMQRAGFITPEPDHRLELAQRWGPSLLVAFVTILCSLLQLKSQAFIWLSGFTALLVVLAISMFVYDIRNGRHKHIGKEN